MVLSSKNGRFFGVKNTLSAFFDEVLLYFVSVKCLCCDMRYLRRYVYLGSREEREGGGNFPSVACFRVLSVCLSPLSAFSLSPLFYRGPNLEKERNAKNKREKEKKSPLCAGPT